MSYQTIPDLPLLDPAEMDDAIHLTFRPRFEGDEYENQAGYTTSDPGAGWTPFFSFTAVAGALYEITAESWFDPYNLVLYDDGGYPIAEDDGWGPVGEDGLAFVAPYSGTYYIDASWHQGGFPPYSDAALTILEDLDEIPVNVGEGTPFDDAITGTAGHDDLYGNGGWDLLIGGGGDDLLDGGSGTDTALYDGKLADYELEISDDGIIVTDFVGLDGVDMLASVERVEFADVGLAFDVDGNAGAAYRLYQAAFDRVPDEVGLGFWIAALDGGTSLRQVANDFIASNEFRAIYGTNPGNLEILTGFYDNVLHRAPDAQGLAFWLDVLNNGRDTLAGVLTGFSESDENRAQLVGVMEDGMAYQPWA